MEMLCTGLKTHTWLKAESATGNFGKKYPPTWPARAALSKQTRDQSSSPLLLTHMGTPKQDRGEESILSSYSTRRLELTLPILTLTLSQTQSDSGGTQLRSPRCPLAMANCQNVCPDEHAQHLRALLEKLRPPTLLRGFGGFFLASCHFLFFFF